MKKYLYLFAIILIPFLTITQSCSKSAFTEATVVSDGDPSIHGCGWLLNIGGTEFYPVALKESDKVDGKVIKIQYSVSAAPFQCTGGAKYPVATITQYF